MVIGPTPPGTGVMAPATFRASSKATSPTSRALAPASAGTRLMPTSITMAPGLIQSPRIICGRETGLIERMLSRLIAALLLCAVCAAAHADDGHHTFWIVKGAHNTVYLLGSVHVLKPADSDLPSEAVRAYASAKALVMEIDLNNVTADSLLGGDLSMESLPAGQTLAEALGP